MTSGRVAVFGDIGGHRLELRTKLLALGMDSVTNRLPDDLTVIQVGDLIHRGPDSLGVLLLIDRIMRAQPDRWVQLAGNHESLYLTEKDFHWPESLDPIGQELLRTWWRTGRLLVAAAVQAPDGPYLISHAGLTAGYLPIPEYDRPAEQIARRLNDRIGTPTERTLFEAGHMLGGGAPNINAGPLWARSDSEVYLSWLDDDPPLPFHQVHGHSSPYSWSRTKWNVPDLAQMFSIDLDLARKHTITHFGGRRIVGIDPGHGTRAVKQWEPLVLTDAVVTSGNR